ncbi:MAG: rRNA pseudouridine synthase [Paenibacillaceae bacterium]|jgi:23S rRNA pseudouridine2605 synthase|nr:rRNA pseudouridine synthase [Paenibacillaceae bacterium]
MERLQKVLAQAGIASRRKCEEYITSGRVTVNDVLTKELGVKVDPAKDIIKVDGKPVKAQQKIYLMLNKPKGVITSAVDPEGRKVVSDFLPGVKERVYPVGRLDYDTEGLLILTNDGEFANLLTHPKHHIPRTYHATVKGNLHGSVLDKLKAGVKLDDGMTAPAEADYYDINPDKNETVVAITIYEGRNRQVRRMFEAVNHPVVRLKRVMFGSLALMGLPRGKYRSLSSEEVKDLQNEALALKEQPDQAPASPSTQQEEDQQ